MVTRLEIATTETWESYKLKELKRDVFGYAAKRAAELDIDLRRIQFINPKKSN